MNRTETIRKDKNYKSYLDHGFVGLIDHMGSDKSVEFATRMSYGEGTRPISDTRALLRYLVRHHHTSPIEMAEVVFHLRVPIFVMRQLVRHRTASLNEESLRYSVASDDFYVPTKDRIKTQSKVNKQGSGEIISMDEVLNRDPKDRIVNTIKESYLAAKYEYDRLITDDDLARELARTILPVGGYTEVVWKCDLKNFFHMIKLRADPHAQEEIRNLADLMYEFVKPMFPILCEAFEDYWLNGKTLSVFELDAIRNLLGKFTSEDLVEALNKSAFVFGNAKLSKRELDEFVTAFRNFE